MISHTGGFTDQITRCAKLFYTAVDQLIAGLSNTLSLCYFNPIVSSHADATILYMLISQQVYYLSVFVMGTLFEISQIRDT